MLRCIEIFCTFLVHSIVPIIFYIGIFLSVSGFGHAICNSSRNQHAVILLDMMLRARIAIMNMRAMDGGDCDRKSHNEPKNTCMKNGFERGQSGKKNTTKKTIFTCQ